jgi:hypothetical protein
VEPEGSVVVGVDGVVVGAAVVLTGGAVAVAGGDAGDGLALESEPPAEPDKVGLDSGVLLGEFTVRLERPPDEVEVLEEVLVGALDVLGAVGAV